jgi:hypothetical protein
VPATVPNFPVAESLQNKGFLGFSHTTPTYIHRSHEGRWVGAWGRHCRHRKVFWLRKSQENAVNQSLLHTKIQATKMNNLLMIFQAKETPRSLMRKF